MWPRGVLRPADPFKRPGASARRHAKMPYPSEAFAMKGFVVAGVVLALLSVHPARAEGGYALYTQWDDTKLNLTACQDNAERALHAASFKADTARTKTSVYARRAGYTAAIRCVESKQMVIFVISGPEGPVASKYLDEIANKF
jgi:hypothetical protein